MQLTFQWGTLRADDLDGIMAEVAARAGLSAVHYLTARFGGESLYVPKAPLRHGRWRPERLNYWLAEVSRDCSPSLARILVELRGGEMVYIPSRRQLEERAVARAVRAAYDGTNAGLLAERFSLTRRKVRKILREEG